MGGPAVKGASVCHGLLRSSSATPCAAALAPETRRTCLQLRGGQDATASAAPSMEELMGSGSNIVPTIASKVGRNLHNQEDHPLQIIKTWIAQHFMDTFVDSNGAPMFDCLDNLSPVVTTAMCFDDLLTPPDHPSRSRSDTYYLDEQRLLRSHMTAHQTTLLREGRRSFLFAGDVYRRDAVDSCHYPCFHQVRAAAQRPTAPRLVFQRAEATPSRA